MKVLLIKMEHFLFSKMISFPLPLPEHEEIFLWYLLWESGQDPGGKPQNIVRAPMAAPTWSFQLSDLSTVSLQQFVNYSSHFTTLALVPQWFLLLNLCTSNLWLLLFPYLCPYYALPYVLPSLTHLRKVADSSVWSALYLLLGWSGYFQAPYIWNWILEVLDGKNV